MKKSLVAIGVIVAVGAVWTGTAWYTGSKIETELNRFINNANQSIAMNAPESGVTLKVENFKRGVFSSQANIVVLSNEAPDDSVVFNTNIDHGPFPLSQLAKFNLIPKLGAANIELEHNATTQELFEMTKGKPFVTGTAVVGYSKNIDSNLDLLPLEFTKDDAVLSFSGSKLVFNTSSELKKIDISLITDNFNVHKEDKTEGFTLKGLKLTSNVDKTEHGFYIGNQEFIVSDIDLNIPETNFSFKNLSVASDTSIENENVKGNISYSVDDVSFLGENFGSGKMAISIDKLNAVALGKFVEQYNQAVAEGLATGSPTAAAEKIAMDMVTKTLPELIQSKPTFSISPVYWKNAAGESSSNLTLSFNKWDQNELTALAMSNKIDEAVKSLFTSFDFDLKLNKPMVIQLMSQVLIADNGVPVSAEIKKEYEQQAIAQFDEMQEVLTADMFTSPMDEMFMTDEQRAEKAKQKKSPWMVENGNDLTMTVKFAGNDITFNADKYTLADFLTKLGLMTNPEDAMNYDQIPEPLEVPAENHENEQPAN
ncbi:YdgA family protein [Providencia sneebia]|uniref:GTP-binding protein YdgA n=1 Tax=Providencia sneebia DSM 19967 TaxID=1141660 RepID=K8WIW6_9GAMM|nr:YdgA family protein [Providencia sneebia]EKT56180.1 hypothetical protein OO7_09572 [Providencia sneebia DSM 19967]